MSQSKMSKYSYRSLKVEMLNHEKTSIACATGFTYRLNKKCYLVTNRHVVTGKNLVDDSFIDGCSSENRPFWLKITCPQVRTSGAPSQITVPLYDSVRKLRDGEPYPLFRVPEGLFAFVNPRFDIAVLDLDKESENLLGDHYYEDSGNHEVDLSVTDTVYVVGYPKSAGQNLGAPPVWTRGSVASEPNVDDGRARLLIDARTRPGQSGSPVIQYRKGFEYSGESGIKEYFEERAVLIGVYSGRTDKDSDLGRVWSPMLINDAIEMSSMWL